MITRAILSFVILTSTTLSGTMAQTTYTPCPELQSFMSRTSPLERQLMAANDELHVVIRRMQSTCEQRSVATAVNTRRSKIGKKRSEAEDRERYIKSAERGEYADLGKN